MSKARKGTKTTMKKRFLSFLTAVSMIVGTIPIMLPNTAIASETEQKSNIDRSAYEELGFTGLDAKNDSNSFFGTANTVLMPKKELYLNYNGSSNFGQLLRSGIDLYKSNSDRKATGAYKRYGQYKNGDWANLKDENGYNYGQLGGTEPYSNIESKNKHQRNAYAESVAFNSGSGRESNVATVYIRTKDGNRRNQRISLEIATFGNDGKSRNTASYVVEYCNENSALNEQGYFYTMDYAALIDVTAGDYDGDGMDEIAVYGANNKVIIYKYRNSKLYTWKTINTSEISADSGVTVWGDGYPVPNVKRAAVVTLESFDLDKNNADELVITVSNPQDADYKHMNYGYIYSYNSGSRLAQSAKIPLYDDSTVLRSASAAAGDFDGSGQKTLVFGGRASSTSNPNSIRSNDKIATRTVTYNHNTKSYEASSIQKYNESFNIAMMADRGLKYYSPIGMAAFNMYGEKDPDGNSGTRLFLFDRLYKYAGGAFQADGTTINYGSDQRNNANEKEDKDQIWVSNVIAGNFTKKDIGRREQLIAVVGQKQSGDDRYWFQIAYICADNNNNVYRNWEGVVNQATSYYNRTDKSREGAYLTISAPDVDNDSMLLKFKGSETYYSKPEVQAIMQSAPYFEDVADVYDNYLNNGATSYGKSKSDTKGVSASIETSLGVYTSEEASLGGAAEFEASVAAVASYEHQTTWTTSTEVEYAGGIGDDYVVMYTVPFHRYVYEGNDKNGKTVPVIIEEPMTPATVIVTVDKYDEIASMYNGLEPIRGNVLTSAPGNPMSYTTWGKGEFKPIGDTQMLTNAGKGNGATVTVSRTDETEHENSFAVGIEENLKAGGGAGFLGNNVKAGVVQSMTASVGGVFSNMSGVAYTGTVDNLPEGVSDFGFNWQLGYSKIKFNGEDVIVIGYKTSNVKRPPSAPKNAVITDIGRNSMTLEWDETPEAAIYELSFVTPDGEELPLANIPGTIAENGSVSYDVKNLNQGTSYTFTVRASDAYGVRSLPTPQVTGTTLADGDGEFSIAEQPKDAETAAGKDAVFSIKAIGTSTEPIQYQWYRYDSEDRSWEKTGANSSELRFTATEELDGSRYYCTVYQGTKVLKSKSVSLKIGLSASSTALTVSNAGKKLKNDDFVMSDYESVTKNSTEQKSWREETYTDTDGKVYKKLAQGETETEGGDGQTSYTYTGPFVWTFTDENGETSYYAGNNAPDTANKYDVVSRYTFMKGEDIVETEKTASDFASPVTINGRECARGYKIISSEDYIYICAYTDAENNSVTEYYKKNSEGTYEAYTLDSQKDSVSIDGTEYLLGSFTGVKKEYTDSVIDEVTEKKSGEEIVLSAEVEESAKKAVTNGNVNFRILNKSTGVIDTVKGSYDGSKKIWTASYRFPDAGMYDITAIYMGSEIFRSSVSDKITVNAYKPESRELSISGGNMVYGSGLSLNPVIVEKNKNTSVSGKASYTVKKLTKNSKNQDEWQDCGSGLISGDMFVPDETGKYSISAETNDGTGKLGATTTVEVTPRTVTVRPNDAAGNLNEDRAAREGKVSVNIDGMPSNDEAALRSMIKVKSDAFTARTKGEYPIEVTVDTPSAFSSKYSIVTLKGTYSLTQDTVTVKAKAKANGSILITYVTDKYNQSGDVTGKSAPLSIESGTQIPKGADVTFSAQPIPGFGVASWTVPDGMTNPGKDSSFTITNIDKNVDVSVSFAYSLNQISFTAADEDGRPVPESAGRVVGAYEDGRNFNSGDTLSMGKKVTLTAQPGEGYVLCGWQKLNSENGGWEYIKSENGKDNDTGLTQTVSNVTSPESYRAMFAQKEQKTVSFAVVDSSGKPITSAEVYVNGVKAAEGADGKLVYTAYKHEKLDIEVKTPDTVLINYWETGNETAAGKTNKYTLYDLKDDTAYTIYCTIPNTREITYGVVMTDGSTPAWTHEYIVAKRAGGDKITSPATQPQGVQLEFTAVPADGYRVKEWTLNGTVVLGADQNSYTLTVDDSAAVNVVFEKKPTVKMIFDGSMGNVSADSDNKPVVKEYVEFGSNVVFTIEPSKGYVIDTALLNGNAAELTSGTSNTDKRFITVENVNSDQTLTVTFKHKPIITVNGGSFTLTGTSDFTEKEISSGAYVDFGSDAKLTAVPDSGYVVDMVKVNGAAVGFDVEENSDEISAEIKNINADKAVEITYKKKPVISIVTGAGGSLEANGTADFAAKNISNGDYVDFGSDIALAVTPDYGYVVDSIKADGVAVSFNVPENSDNISVTIPAVNADKSIEVTFRALEKYTVSFEVINTEAGAAGAAHGTMTVNTSRKDMDSYKTEEKNSVSGTAEVYEGGRIVFNAVADTDYRVREWTVDNAVSSSKSRTLTLTSDEVGALADKTVKVQFEEGKGRLTIIQPGNGVISAMVADTEFTSGGTPEIGAEVEFTLTPNAHFVLKRWLLDGAEVQNANDLRYIYTADGSDAAVSAELEKEKLNVTAAAEENGTVSGLPEIVRHGTEITLTATPKPGYEFEGWYVNGTRLDGAGAVYTFTAEESADYIAKFTVKEGKTVTYSVNNEEFGTISALADGKAFASGDKVSAAKKINFTVTPNDGYRVKEWIGLPSDAVIGADNLSAEIAALDSDAEVTAVLEEIPTYSITLLNTENGKLTAEVNGAAADTVREGTEVTFTAVPDTGYMFSKWTNDADGMQTASFKLNVTKNMTVGAEFIPASYYDVKYEVLSGTTGGTASGKADETDITSGIVVRHAKGSKLVFTAVPEQNKMVKEWRINGEVSGELSNRLEFNLEQNTEVTVEFEDLQLWKIADDVPGEYSLTDIVRTPSDYGTDSDRTIRNGGTAEFKVAAAAGKTVTGVEIADDTANTVEISRNTDGTYSVKLTGIKKDVTLSVQTENGIPLTIENAENGTIAVKRENTELASGAVVRAGDILTVTASPAKNYKVSAVKVNGNILSGGSYTVSDTDTSVVISAEFTYSGGSSTGGGGGGGSSSVTVSFESNGGSKVDSIIANRNDVIAEPSAPAKVGFDFAGWYTDKELNNKYDFAQKVTKSFTLYAKWSEKQSGDNERKNPFTDVHEDEWFYDDVEYVFSNNLMNGITDTTFDPNGLITRAMLVTILWRAEGGKQVNYAMTFEDVDLDGYYAEAVRWAASENIVKGYSDTEFMPDRNVTREQIAAIMHRYAAYKGYDVSVGENTNILSYSDYSDISGYAVESVQYAVGAGLMHGKTENTINPADNATRAEIAAIIQRFNKINK